MQDSICDSSNTGSYGSTSSNGESGHYEMNQLVATTYDSTNGITHLYFERNLQYNYQSGQKSSSAGQKRFQVVYVPNCGTITFYGNPYVPLWDGTKGGVFVSVSQYFNLNGYTISVNSAGFRGIIFFQFYFQQINNDYLQVDILFPRRLVFFQLQIMWVIMEMVITMHIKEKVFVERSTIMDMVFQKLDTQMVT